MKQRVESMKMRVSGMMQRLRGQRFAWSMAWEEVQREMADARMRISRKQATIAVPLEEYCVLLEAGAREARAYVQLGTAQEQIRVLKGTLAAYEAMVLSEAACGLQLDQLLHVPMPEKAAN
jgi:hypothetical protein